MSASWINLADRRRRNLFFDSIGQTGNAQNKQMLSALPPLATGERTFRIGSFVPEGDYSHRSKQPHYSTTASARAINVR